MDDFDRGAMLETFIHEMGMLVDQLENVMIATSEEYTMDTINEIFRIMHTIKGSASMMQFTSMADGTHSIEDLFFYLREHNPDDADYSLITDLVLEVVDFVKEQLAKIEMEEEPDPSPLDLMERIKQCLKELQGVKEEVAASKPAAHQAIPMGNSAIGGSKGYKVKAFFQEGSEMENVRAYTVIHNLKDVAYNIVTTPENVLDESSIWAIRTDGFVFSFSSDLDVDEIRAILMKSVYIRDLELEEVEASEAHLPIGGGSNLFHVSIRFQNGCEMENVRAYGVVHKLSSIAEVVSHTPEDLFDETNIEYIRSNGFTMNVSTDMDEEELEEYLGTTIFLEELKIEIKAKATSKVEQKEVLDMTEQTPVVQETVQQAVIPNEIPASTTNAEPVPATEKPAAAAKKPSHSISVSVGKLDQLLNLVGELVISEAMVTQNPELEGLDLDSFTKESRQLRKIITEVQDTVMSMRMVPLSPTFFKMHRIVRDMCKQLNKEVQLEVVGDDTEVDKNIIEHIADPLMHIIRNSVDHGIEKPEQRAQAGKDEKGTVILEAKNSGGDVLIIVKDDGAGFNRDKILEKAKRQGLLFKPEEEYSDKEIYQFIFYPGFSTNEQVTTFSGRGVGMDVVSTNIEHVGGTVIAESVEGEGSSITLKIPLTLAIIEGMIIRIGDAKYTIPIMDIKRSLKITKKDIVLDPNNNEMVMVRGEAYNLVRLNRYFGLDFGADEVEDGIVLMLENSEQTVCVFADELIGEQQIVVKNMPKYIKKVPGLSGCTLLGNGDISLIINVPAFFDR